jgi:predicted dehydrogenase
MDTRSLANDLRIAIAGCGSMGQRHISNLISLGHHPVVAVDPVEEQRRMVRENFNLRTVADLDDIWALSPDVVFVTSPSNLHLSQALKSAEHGCHLFIEKPLSHSLEGIAELIAAIVDRRLITMIGCNMRFHPGPAMVKNLLEKDTIGNIVAARIQTGSYLPRWRPEQDYRGSYSASPHWGGAILDCIHEIDLALWYLGPARLIAAVHLPARTLGLETDGLAEIILKHDSGCMSSVHLNFVQRDYRRTCQIIGSEGTIYWDFADHAVRLYGPNGETVDVYSESTGWQLNQMYVHELEHFLASVKNNTQTMNPVAASLTTLGIALEARQDDKRLL